METAPEPQQEPQPVPQPDPRRVRLPLRILGGVFCLLVAAATYFFIAVVLPDMSTYKLWLLIVLVVPVVAFVTYLFAYATITGRRASTWFTRH